MSFNPKELQDFCVGLLKGEGFLKSLGSAVAENKEIA